MAERKPYVVVKFLNEDSVEVVPSTWIECESEVFELYSLFIFIIITVLLFLRKCFVSGQELE